MELSISKEGFKEKPKIPGITYEKKIIEPKDLESYIRKGHVLSANFKASYPITQRNRTLSKFQSIPYVMIDLDNDVDLSLEILVDSLPMTPTISYSTFSHGIKGNRYRLLYIFDKAIISTDTYRMLYSFICKECNLSIGDDCGKNPVQACIGSKHNCDYVYSGEIYCIDDLVEEDKDYKKLEDSNFDVSGQIDYIIKEKKGSNIQCTCPIIPSEEDKVRCFDSVFLDDYFNLSYKEVLDKYNDKYDYFDKTPLPMVDADTPIIHLTENYVEIKRYRYKEAILDSDGGIKTYNYRVRKLRDGEGRKRKIYTSTLLRRVMMPNISFPHLLYCALYDLYHYCYNEVDPIGKKRLYDVVINAARKTACKSLVERSRLKKKYIANPAYCEKHGVSKSKAVGCHKRMLKEQRYVEIGKLYDGTLTYEENQQKMKEYGLEASIKAIQRYRTENHLPPLPRKSRGKKLKENPTEDDALITGQQKPITNAHRDFCKEDCVVLAVMPFSEEERRRMMEEVIKRVQQNIA